MLFEASISLHSVATAVGVVGVAMSALAGMLSVRALRRDSRVLQSYRFDLQPWLDAVLQEAVSLDDPKAAARYLVLREEERVAREAVSALVAAEPAGAPVEAFHPNVVFEADLEHGGAGQRRLQLDVAIAALSELEQLRVIAETPNLAGVDVTDTSAAFASEVLSDAALEQLDDGAPPDLLWEESPAAAEPADAPEEDDL